MRYFFHVMSPDQKATDDCGVDYASDEEALIEAGKAARELLSNAIKSALIPPTAVIVVDANGRSVVVIRLFDLLPADWRAAC